MSELQGWAVFVSVADRGSFTAAARALAMPKSTVSKRLAELEQELGVALFERTSRRVALTGAGLRLLPRARRWIEEAGAMAREASDPRPGGRLVVTAPPLLHAPLLAPLLPAWLAAMPAMSLTLRSDAGSEPHADLSLRLVGTEEARRLPPGAGRLAEWEERLVASPAYIVRRGLPLAPSELARHDVIEHGGAASAWTLRGPHGLERVEVAGRLQVGGCLEALDAARRGLGIARVWSLLAEPELQARTLLPVLPHHRAERRELWAVASPEARAHPGTTLLLELLQRRLAPREVGGDEGVGLGL